jgi:hypothetical protein
MYSDNEVRGLRDRVRAALLRHRVSNLLSEEIETEFRALIGDTPPPLKSSVAVSFHLSKINKFSPTQRIDYTNVWLVQVPPNDSSVFRWLTVTRGNVLTGYLVRSPRGVLMKEIRDELEQRGFEWFANHSRLGAVVHQNQLSVAKWTYGLSIQCPCIVVHGVVENDRVVLKEAIGLYEPKFPKMGKTSI